MKMFNKYIAASLITVTGLFSCQQDVTVDEFNKGEADFSNYVALGDSISAGFSDGSLYKSAQENSFAAILGNQFTQVGGGEFKQPLIEDENGGLLVNGNVVVEPKYVFSAAAGAPVRVDTKPTTETLASIANEGPYNNLAVPGAKVSHLLFDGYGSAANLAAGFANPFYVRFSNPNTSVLKQALSQAPTFYTLFVGSNDVLGYAFNGGESGDITPVAEFQTYYGGLVDAMSKTEAKGVLVNLPQIETLPYFNVVPNKPIPMDASTSAAVNIAYREYNGALQQFQSFGLISADEVAARTIEFVEGQNAPVIVDDSLTKLQNPATGAFIPKLRQVKAGELLTLAAAAKIGKLAVPGNPQSVIGVGVPLGGEYVLDTTEIKNVQDAITGYNNAIATIASNYNVALYDFDATLKSIQEKGIKYEGTSSSVEFVTGGIFSLDGIHPTQRGSAILANNIIDVINSSYGASVPKVNLKDYPGVALQ